MRIGGGKCDTYRSIRADRQNVLSVDSERTSCRGTRSDIVAAADVELHGAFAQHVYRGVGDGFAQCLALSDG